MDKEYTLYCDESEKSGRFYSNFYGGVLVGSSQHDRIISRLENEKLKLNLQGEIKWSKVTERYLEKYKFLISIFFDEVKQGHLRIRIMFRQNAFVPNNLTAEDIQNAYFKLYYQFIKHAYGLEYAKLSSSTKLRLYFDTFPENREAASHFKGYLLGLNKNHKIQKTGLFLKEEDIAEINSHDHVILQCLDVILGSMHFRLNNKHLEKISGTISRAKRTIAKESLYKRILQEIKTLKEEEFKYFNIGVSTASSCEERWTEPYLHWSFVPRTHNFNKEFTKGEKRQPQSAYITSDA